MYVLYVLYISSVDEKITAIEVNFHDKLIRNETDHVPPRSSPTRKSNCEYFEISDKYATYNCADSLFDGTIGFMSSEGSGFIQMTPNIDSSLEKD